MKKYIRNSLLILLLIAIDQFIKLYIWRHLMEYRINILGEFIYFRPTFNEEFSWTNIKFNLNMNWFGSLLLCFIALLFIIGAYYYLKGKCSHNKYLHIGYIFLLAGTFCSIIDKLFWGTSLDYLAIKGFYIIDLKDCYVTVGEIIFIVLFIYYEFKIEKEKKAKLQQQKSYDIK